MLSQLRLCAKSRLISHLIPSRASFLFQSSARPDSLRHISADSGVPAGGISTPTCEYFAQPRAMASIKTIDSLSPIPGADSIECATVGGWTVIVKRGEYKAGDAAVYCEIDSWIPHSIAPFLTSEGKQPREFNGVKGERLRTIKLRGQLSQGLLLPLSILPPDISSQASSSSSSPASPTTSNPILVDVTEVLGIQKWEMHEKLSFGSQEFPLFLKKTQQPRIQNIVPHIDIWTKNPQFTWEVTEKLDGSSMTIYSFNQRTGVCSRNFDLTEDITNLWWQVAIKEDLIEKVKKFGKNMALQGELVGPDTQGNKYKSSDHQFFLFDIYDIDIGRYLPPADRHMIAKELGIKHAPVLSTNAIISESVSDMLKSAEGKSALNLETEREGLVYKANAFGGPSFKVISNKWLLKHKE